MPINNNFSFRSISDYFSSHGKGGTKIRAGAEKISSSFSAMRNGSWAMKCAQFDAAALARRLRSHPQAQQAYAVARQRLEELHVQMTALIQQLYGKLKQYGIYNSHQPHDGERAIHRHWRTVLPPGASILPGAYFDANTKMERFEWHRQGVKWNATRDPATGARISVSDWRSKASGWQQREEIEHNLDRNWTARRHEGPPLRHFRVFSPSMPNSQGWFVGMIQDHVGNTVWTTYRHPGQHAHFRCTDWSEPDQDGVVSRTSFDERTKTRWHDTYHPANGEHHSKSDWRTSADGVSQERTAKNHVTGHVFIEVNKKLSPSHFADHESAAKDLHKLAEAPLAAPGPGERGQDKIRTQLKKLALRWPPDKPAGKSDEEKREAQQRYAKRDAAYRFLVSPVLARR
jgi:hypothetical protein